MATNPFFKDSQVEQKLLNDLTIETIKATGRDIVYIPRENQNLNKIFGEDMQGSKFESGYTVEVYVEEVLQFGGERDIASKFGIQLTDKITLTLSRTRFFQEVSSKQPEIKYPREGDLIYFPMVGYLFEINFVEDKQPFFQFGSLTTYKLSCEVFRYSHETIDTGITEIDEVQTDRKKYATLLTLSSIPISGATFAFYNGETVYQRVGFTGAAASYVDATGKGTLLRFEGTSAYLTDVEGTFVAGATATLRGVTSTAEYYISAVSATTIIIPTNPDLDSATNDNNDIQYRAEKGSIINFDEIDPFSEGNY